MLCGAVGIIFLLEDRGVAAAYFVWIACLFDFFDGFAARMLKVTSPIGKELDSLADVVSFGLLPALAMYKMIDASTSSETLPYIGLMIAMFSALRLAIFNVDETQRDSFKGLNTPANAIFVTSLPLIEQQAGSWLYQTWTLIAITVLFSFLLVSRIEIFALKFKTFKWAENRIRFTFLILSVLLLIVFQLVALPMIILLYILLSLAHKAFLQKA